MSRHPISAYYDGQGGIFLASGCTANVQHSATLCLDWMGACSMQLVLSPFVTSTLRSRTCNTPRTMVKGHAKTYDMKPVIAFLTTDCPRWIPFAVFHKPMNGCTCQSSGGDEGGHIQYSKRRQLVDVWKPTEDLRAY